MDEQNSSEDESRQLEEVTSTSAFEDISYLFKWDAPFQTRKDSNGFKRQDVLESLS
ncbi:hypothetical protein Sjap_007576 [Stephania japonica]|uniref:Uncharacterized protein n=1 Tax=Stephania japonica TaxID=461633 RepID=A0AAP0JQ89_9MAGN